MEVLALPRPATGLTWFTDDTIPKQGRFDGLLNTNLLKYSTNKPSRLWIFRDLTVLSKPKHLAKNMLGRIQKESEVFHLSCHREVRQTHVNGFALLARENSLAVEEGNT